MKILYGVAGEGMGHAARSKVVISYLVSRGDSVLVVSSGRAAGFLIDAGFDVIRVDGLTLRYADGGLDIAGSAAANLANLPSVIQSGFAAWSDFDHFAPDVIVSDFDSLVSLYGRSHGIPVVSIDNMSIIDRCQHSPAVLAGYESDFELARVVVESQTPGSVAYVVTTFFCPPVKPEDASNTYLVPPILRDAILRARPTNSGVVLVYQTQSSDTRLLDLLAEFPSQRFVVYGSGPAATAARNVTLKPFSEQGFVDDLAASSGVISNGGFTLLGEALYLGKPVYSVPVRNHAEQILNARYLAVMGFGATSDVFDRQVLAWFLNDDGYARRIQEAGRQHGNAILYSVVDDILPQ